MDLHDCRAQIDDIDQQMRRLFLQRLSVAEQVGQVKLKSGEDVYKPERESQMIDALCQGLPRETALPYSAFLRQTVRVSRERQYQLLLERQPERFPFSYLTQPPAPRTVCYQGLPASYSHSAARTLFPHSRLSYDKSFEAVFATVAQGRADAGVVPMENSTAGTINEVYDLLSRYELCIVQAFAKAIGHCLCAPKGVALSDVRRVLSHPQALRQCQRYLSRRPWESMACANTAVAARQIALEKDGISAAICSREAAQLYDLAILQPDIHDRDDNQTRFVVIDRSLRHQAQDDHISLAFHLSHTSGTLASVLSLIADYGCNLTQLHARPLQGGHWEYIFYLDFIGSLTDPAIRAMLYQLHEELPYVRLTGSYHIQEEDAP